MAMPISAAYAILIGAIILGLLIVLLWEQITSIKFVRTALVALANFIKLFSQLIGGAIESFIKTFIWF
ncbi:MAG: hypothetical protein GTN40_04940 [Candidatus Aenigmarchaeota archaeon]|nr:hypothetical protein [Candidatus Aenigmarchaeota archaeon]